MDELINKMFGPDHLWLVFLDLEIFLGFVCAFLYLIYLALTGQVFVKDNSSPKQINNQN